MSSLTYCRICLDQACVQGRKSEKQQHLIVTLFSPTLRYRQRLSHERKKKSASEYKFDWSKWSFITLDGKLWWHTKLRKRNETQRTSRKKGICCNEEKINTQEFCFFFLPHLTYFSVSACVWVKFLQSKVVQWNVPQGMLSCSSRHLVVIIINNPGKKSLYDFLSCTWDMGYVMPYTASTMHASKNKRKHPYHVAENSDVSRCLHFTRCVRERTSGSSKVN